MGFCEEQRGTKVYSRRNPNLDLGVMVARPLIVAREKKNQVQASNWGSNLVLFVLSFISNSRAAVHVNIFTDRLIQLQLLNFSQSATILELMANIESTDFLCTLHVQIKPNHASAASKLTSDIFKRLCHQTSKEQGCVSYSFTTRQPSTSGEDELFVCREIYKDGPAVLAHLDNVGSLLKEMMEVATFPIFEVHGPREELEAIQDQLPEGAQLWFVVEYTGGFFKKGFY